MPCRRSAAVSGPRSPAASGSSPHVTNVTAGRSATGDGRDDRDRTAFGRGSGEAVDEPYVVVADVDVDETAQLALLVHDAALDPRVRGVQRVDDLGQRPAVNGHLRLALGVGPQDRRHSHAHTHPYAPFT